MSPSDDIEIISLGDAQYPPLLREIHDPPEQLYVRGNIAVLTHPLLMAVVGSRKATAYGAQCVTQLFTPFVRAGGVIVSGLAYGIDSLSHRLCIAAQQPTVAVLGSGVDDKSIYPRIHTRLARDIIASGGAIISEHPPGTAPKPYHFPMRNRIIAGLCRVTVIIEASLKSGSLITARLALEDGRDVGAVPGPITAETSAGTNLLIRDGAVPITAPQDILDLFDMAAAAAQPAAADSSRLPSAQQDLVGRLTGTPQHIDELAALVPLPVPELAATLMELELQGYVRQVGGMKYVRAS